MQNFAVPFKFQLILVELILSIDLDFNLSLERNPLKYSSSTLALDRETVLTDQLTRIVPIVRNRLHSTVEYTVVDCQRQYAPYLSLPGN